MGLGLVRYTHPSPCSGQFPLSPARHSHCRFTGSAQPRSYASRSPISSCFVGMVSTGRLSRGRFPAFRTGQIANPTAKTCRQDRHRQRDRHGSKFAFRFHQGCEKLTQSTAPQSGQESLKAVSRAKMRRVRQRGFRSGTFASGCPSPQRPPKAKSATAKCVRLPSGAEQGRLRI